MQVVIIGSGNTATVLGRKIKEAGHPIPEIWARNIHDGEKLATELEARFIQLAAEGTIDADIYLVAISDDAIKNVLSVLPSLRKLVIHTAGSVSRDFLTEKYKNVGVMYPLQSLRKDMTSLPQIPMLIDANTDDNLTLLHDFATTISSEVQIADDEKRLKMHIAAVMVNNFGNYLYSLSSDYCCKENLDFAFLLPLIRETANRLEIGEPWKMQTGPAIRNDESTIKKHIEALEDYKEQKSLYTFFTKAIREWHQKKSSG